MASHSVHIERARKGSWWSRVRVAVLLSEEDRNGLAYMDIGHDQYEGILDERDIDDLKVVEEIWYIDLQGNLHTLPAGPDISHRRTMGIDFMNSDRYQAKGRYMKSNEFPEGRASLVVSPDMIDLKFENPRKYEFKKKQFARILEKKYGPQVAIYPFQ